MALAYLQIFADKEELLEPMDDAERGRLLTAMLAYALHDEAPVLTGNERYIWPVFRQMIDQSKAALASKQAGGRARQSSGQHCAADGQQASAEVSSHQQEPADSQQDSAEAPINQESRIKNQDTRNKNQEREGKRARFLPPSEADVRAYAAERGMTIDAKLFVAHYAARGWKISGHLMEDWHAAVDAWVCRDKGGSPPRARGGPKVVEQQQYTQREYTHSEDAADAMMAAFQAGGAHARAV